MVTVVIVAFVIYETISFRNQNTLNNDKVSLIKPTLTKTDKAIEGLEQRLKREPKNSNVYVALANAYLQKVREDADTSYYSKIERLLDHTDTLGKNNSEVLEIKAFLAYGRHDFYKGMDFAQQAVTLNPRKASHYGALADGQIELGKYDEAVESVQKMVDIRPDLSSYNRVAHLRELFGDIDGAKNALMLAISAGATSSENVAFSQVELGKLYLRSDLKKSAQLFEKALLTHKDYPPAFAGLGRIAFANNENEKAKEYFKKAFAILPIAQYAIDLRDLYFVTGNKAKSDQYFELAKLAYQQSISDGVNTDLEYSLFLADSGQNVSEAFEKAQNAYKNRPTIYSADVLAWSLYKNNNADASQQYTTESLRLGEFDPLLLFHAGMIADRNGNKIEAKRLLKKAIALHPHFSLLYSKMAKTKIEEL